MTLRVLSLFSGIGGIDLGLERAGMRVVAQCEIDPFCRAVLAKHWPHVERFDDVQRLDGTVWAGRVDLVAGGFPCQDISTAGKGKGIEHGERSGLWREMHRIVAECRPTWVLIENVPALRTRGADRVLADLESLGYACVPLVVGAWAVGAPHRRDRVWIVGRLEYPDNANRGRPSTTEQSARCWGAALASEAGLADAVLAGLEERRPMSCGARDEVAGTSRRDVPRWPAGPSEPQHEWEEPRLADAEVCGRTGEGQRRQPEVARPATDGEGLAHAESAPWAELQEREGTEISVAGGEDLGSESRSPELALGGSAHGLPAGLVRLAKRCNREALRAYGNAVVPAVVEAIGRAIVAEDSAKRP